MVASLFSGREPTGLSWIMLSAPGLFTGAVAHAGAPPAARTPEPRCCSGNVSR